ncbi:MMPL family transporter [Shouchella lehensis]|uniref:Membrane protein ydfJ n=1 Tax=Shouchella lehensis G1 TaxID=1246626 RepID=A0A060M010_9BACI|nr:MMPL family transporter [Shouchella lehensis]AIC95762.1 Membrane protein ydfJ [Shouchella lehensis G1]
MANLLFNIAKWSITHSKKVISSTVALLAVLAIIGLNLGLNFEEEMTIPGTQADDAATIITENFIDVMDDDETSTIQLVFKAPEKQDLNSENVQGDIEELISELIDIPNVVGVVPPWELGNISEDNMIGYAEIYLNQAGSEVSQETKDSIINTLDITRDSDIQSELISDSVEFNVSGFSHITEVVGIVIAFLILSIMFASFVTAALPIVSAIFGIGISLITIIMGAHIFEIQSVSIVLAAMLGLALGIDYALFIINRFKLQRAKGNNIMDSIAIANGTAGTAVVFAGITVIIGVLGLAVTGIPFLTVMGITSAISVFLAVIISVFVLPAIMSLLGNKISPENEHTFLKKLSRGKNENSNKWGEFVVKRPKSVVLVSLGLLISISLPIVNLQLGLPSIGITQHEDTTERQAYELQTEAYGEGFHASLIIGAEVPDNLENIEETFGGILKGIEGINGVNTVDGPIPNESQDFFLFNVTPVTGPDDQKTKDVVNDIRDYAKDVENENNIKLMVTGDTAMNIDISDKLFEALPIFGGLIILLAYVILVAVFRSLVIPLKAVLGFVLSISATLGFMVFVIQDGNLIELFGFPSSGPILAFLPVVTIGILFGLAMDYELFLVSKMREVYSETDNAKEAVLQGVKDSGKVVVAAALIMMTVFFAFMATPDSMIKSVGMALAFGVLFDAFIVRLTIVPAVMTLLGKHAWYLPRWLDRILPNIDVEGEKLLHEVEKRKEHQSRIE